MTFIRNILKKRLNNKGFSLLEIIISVAALSLSGVFIVQMFLTSEGLNKRARNTDIATNMAISQIENFKMMKSYDGGNQSLRLYYDAEWNEISDTEKVSFVLYFDVSLDDNNENLTGGDIYELNVRITDVSVIDTERELVEYSTKKYFSGAEEL